ncbi:MAG: RHS repeat protein [Chloracidobacterium sp.]|nr:RHS repeat protein [Chloracidobacterium sp.]
MDATLPNQQTAYEYDGNDNLTKVTQSDGTTTQERKFMYDSLSRLKAERQVEAIPTLALDGTHGTADPSKWTKVLKYDTHGLLTDGWDARGVHTQMSYDGLNRVLGVTYSGENGYKTPAVSYTYDQARTGFFNAGALTKVETAQGDATLNPDAPATKTEFDYDLMGRVSKHRQWIGTQQYDLEYGYNLAGQLTSEKYPSGKIVTMGYDAKGRMASVSDQSRTYLSGLVYAGKGGSISAMNFGNGTAETFGLNDRFQIETQELKKGSATLQKYNYNYGQIDVSNGNIAANSNNGQLAKVESWIGTAKQWEQRFGYDSIGRLKESSEIRGDDLSLTYKQVFDYDRFGNMYRKSANNNPNGQINPLPYTPIEEGTDISKSTNRLATNTTYDDAGNATTDNKFRTMGFGYDANGRMVKASKTSVPDALSVYDASGMRVAEKVNDVWRFLIYDVGGKLVTEYGGLQSTDEGGVKYLLSDWQGSTRAVLSNSGTVNGRADYSAFGEEIQAGIGLRTVTQGFGSAQNPRQKYGLTERDDATGLDHTWFRKHENRAGRWTGADPYNGSMNLEILKVSTGFPMLKTSRLIS